MPRLPKIGRMGNEDMYDRSEPNWPTVEEVRRPRMIGFIDRTRAILVDPYGNPIKARKPNEVR